MQHSSQFQNVREVLNFKNSGTPLIRPPLGRDKEVVGHKGRTIRKVMGGGGGGEKAKKKFMQGKMPRKKIRAKKKGKKKNSCRRKVQL